MDHKIVTLFPEKPVEKPSEFYVEEMRGEYWILHRSHPQLTAGDTAVLHTASKQNAEAACENLNRKRKDL